MHVVRVTLGIVKAGIRAVNPLMDGRERRGIRASLAGVVAAAVRVGQVTLAELGREPAEERDRSDEHAIKRVRRFTAHVHSHTTAVARTCFRSGAAPDGCRAMCGSAGKTPSPSTWPQLTTAQALAALLDTLLAEAQKWG